MIISAGALAERRVHEVCIIKALISSSKQSVGVYRKYILPHLISDSTREIINTKQTCVYYFWHSCNFVGPQFSKILTIIIIFGENLLSDMHSRGHNAPTP